MRLKKGMILQVDFDDHVQNGEELIRFRVYGRLRAYGKDHLTLDCWHYPASYTVDENVERFTIGRRMIKDVKQLVQSE